MMTPTGKFRLVLMALLALPLVAGCGGGGMTNVGITPALNAIYVPGQTITLDGGQTLTITASVVNDAQGKGGTITLTGPGTLTQSASTPVASSEKYAVTYTAPMSVTGGQTATITIASVAYPAQTASITITLEPALGITTTTLPAGRQGSLTARRSRAPVGRQPIRGR